MNYFKRLAHKVRSNAPLPLFWHSVLWLASWIQRFGMWLRLRRRPVSVSAYVISMGNITAGGTGKTPAVIERAAQEMKEGKSVAVITRGYGASRESFPLLFDGKESLARVAKRFGDEAALIASRVPGVGIVRSPDRVAGARAAIGAGYDTLILDDAYQAVRLQRNENILLIDATNPFGNGFIIPRGILREQLFAIQRATEVIVTRCDRAPENLPSIVNSIRRFAPKIPIRYTIHEATGLRRLADGKDYPLDWLCEKKLRAVCGIGNPQSFFETLKSLGAIVAERYSAPDHGDIPPGCFRGDMIVVMTEKDALRLDSTPPEHVYALCIALAPYIPAASASASI